MKYQLSFCEIEQLSDNIFEVTTFQGVVIDQKCAKEANDFWFNLRKEPFRLLVNNKNSYSFSFTGSAEIGKNPLREKTAILLNDKKSEIQVEPTIDIKNTTNFFEITRCFKNRESTI